MAKIDSPDGGIPLFNPAAYTSLKTELKKTKGKAPLRDIRKAEFSDILEHAVEETEAPAPASEEALRELLDDVHRAGDALKNRPFPEEIKQYKQAIGNFLHYVVENGYAVAESTSGVNLLKRKKYTIVQVVDHKLEQLAVGILTGQSSQLDLLTRIDEIAGLLVNLLQ